jgi:hypothetical protein
MAAVAVTLNRETDDMSRGLGWIERAILEEIRKHRGEGLLAGPSLGPLYRQ